MIVFQTHTPIEPLRMHVRFRYFADINMPRLLVQYIAGSWVSQWRSVTIISLFTMLIQLIDCICLKYYYIIKYEIEMM